MEQQFLAPQEAQTTEDRNTFRPAEVRRTEELSADTALSDGENSLAVLLHKEAQSFRREEWKTVVWASASSILILWLAHRAAINLPSFPSDLRIITIFLASIGAVLVGKIGRNSYRRKTSLARSMKQSGRREHTGLLVQALRVQNTPVRSLAKHALIKLLPTLQASDGSLLGNAERKILLRQLAISPNDYGYRDLSELFSRSAFRREVDLRVSILKAMEQVGGVKELPVVERLSRGTVVALQGIPTLKREAGVPKEVREAARQCLPFLQARANEQRESEQLLRASSRQTVPVSGLLRPATAQSEVNSEQMLRGSSVRLE